MVDTATSLGVAPGYSVTLPADTSGVFTIALNPAQVDGEALQVTATDAKGNLSAPGSVSAPDLDSPDTTAPNPASGLAISGDGRTVSGRGEPGSTVKVLDAQGNLLAIGTVHHHLTRIRTRLRASLVVESGEVRDVHQIACCCTATI